ncbi:MAG: LysR family transcriptional regulator [Xanthobacteraceae bacterium]|nr:LysR family transcriptional regulator [Xanthobacteraceae bacterium]
MADLGGIDLNLLISLDALIEEANVTRAAARLNISQPALSAQLTRLRHIFGDPLLVPSETGRGMIATTRALQLREPLHAALRNLEALVKRSAAFEPATATRTFTIAANDNAIVMLGLDLIDRMQRAAGPGIRVAFRGPAPEQALALLERGEVDLLIGTDRSVPPGIKASRLFADRYLMAQRRGHPRGDGPLSLADYCALSHVLVSSGGQSFHGFIDDQLKALGAQRKIAVSVHQYNLAPMVVAGTDHVCTLPERFLSRFAGSLDRFELPFETQTFSLLAAWHPRSHADPAHIWLRDQLFDVVRALDGGKPRQAKRGAT